MEVKDVQKRIRQIRVIIDDDETAHMAEKTLWEEVLDAIADGATDDPAALARAALKTTKLAFARWYA